VKTPLHKIFLMHITQILIRMQTVIICISGKITCLLTAVPVLSFVSDNVKDEKGTYRVPFTAKGASGELKYVGHFNCTNHYIKYESVD